jgi:hypothetical protein
MEHADDLAGTWQHSIVALQRLAPTRSHPLCGAARIGGSSPRQGVCRLDPRDYVMALEHARRAVALDPEFWIGHIMLAQTLGELGVLPGEGGRAADAKDVISTLQAASRDRYVPPAAIALIHLGLGDREETFAWLDRAYQERDVHLIFLPVDPKWDPVRSDPRFASLLTRCGFDKPSGG